MTFTDEQLCQAVRTGSDDAFSELWQRHFGEALGYARKLDSAHAEDAVSEVMADVYEALKTGKGPQTSFRSYVLLSVRNRIYTYSRTAVTDELPDERHLVAVEATPELEEQENSSVVQRALEQLPERWREVLILSEVQGKSLAEIGSRLGIESNAVSALLRRARAGMRRSWVSAHFSGAKLSTECSNVVEAFGEFRWGKPTQLQRAWFEKHVRQCLQCDERHGTHAWLAQAVGLTALPVVWLGGTALSRGANATVSTSASAGATLGLSAAAGAIVLGLMIPPANSALAELDTQEPGRVTVTNDADNQSSPPVDDQVGVALPERHEPEPGMPTESLHSEVVGKQTMPQAESAPLTAEPLPAPPPTPGPAPAPSPTPIPIVHQETFSGSTRAGATLEFLLTDGSMVTTVANATGDFFVAVDWPSTKPAFGYTLQRVS